VKYANAGERKVLGRHSSDKTLPSNRRKFYKQDFTNCEEIKTTEMACWVSKTVYWCDTCDVGLCMECFCDCHVQLNFWGSKILWRVRVAPPINVGSGSDDWIFYLAAHITTCLNYSHSYSAIAMPHIQQSLFTTIHTESISSSLHLRLLTPATLDCNCRHSQLALYNYTLQYAVLLWPITVDSLNTSLLHCLNYTTLAPDWHSLLTISLTLCCWSPLVPILTLLRTLTD
jgi:hypothetical protein